ncbi:hypothetical protein [Streptomyces sp. NBC_00847]|uniref:hypothetical protein n=1 Tax=unclassified Streptomyces TaxID=2593676 RepID=UPI00225A3807|nr:hypothetical protein [Streptomyces sp. NBC_00847]MCX4881724.1 hypothetical protein [Streptomyces sp. NBC_00847]
MTQSLSEGPPDQHLYEPPLLFRVHGVVVQGTLVSGLLICAIEGDVVLALVRMVKEWPSFIHTPACSGSAADRAAILHRLEDRLRDKP